MERVVANQTDQNPAREEDFWESSEVFSWEAVAEENMEEEVAVSTRVSTLFVSSYAQSIDVIPLCLRKQC